MSILHWRKQSYELEFKQEMLMGSVLLPKEPITPSLKHLTKIHNEGPGKHNRNRSERSIRFQKKKFRWALGFLIMLLTRSSVEHPPKLEALHPPFCISDRSVITVSFETYRCRICIHSWRTSTLRRVCQFRSKRLRNGTRVNCIALS